MVFTSVQAQQLYKAPTVMTDCGLNYINKSAKVTHRDGIVPGTGLPVVFDVTELPASCLTIKAAYVWWSVSYRDSAQVPAVVTIANPENLKDTVKAKLIGQDKHKCWTDTSFGEIGTRAYRANVTTAIAGNGKYTIEINQPEEEVDGVTLLIVYKDSKARYQGNLYFMDTLVTMQRKDTSLTLFAVEPCKDAEKQSSEGFIAISDLQKSSTDTNFSVSANGAKATMKRKFWNFEFFPIDDITANTNSVEFSVDIDDDCYSIVVVGTYFRTVKTDESEVRCRTCPEPVKFGLEPRSPSFCQGDSVTVRAYDAPHYEWYSLGRKFSTDSAITFKKGGFYMVVAYSDDWCRYDTQFVYIQVHANDKPNAGRDTTICRGHFVRIGPASAAPNCSYKWEPKTGLSSDSVFNPKASPDTTTQYILTVTNRGLCTNYDTVIVKVAKEFTIDPAPDIDTCRGATIALYAGPSGGSKPYSFRWGPAGLFKDPTDSDPEITLYSSQAITVEITDTNNCVVRDTIDINIITDFKVDAGKDLFLCPGTSAPVNGVISGGSPPYTCLWKPSNGLSSDRIPSPVISTDRSIVYYLEVKDRNGCTAFDTLGVIVGDRLVSDYPTAIELCPGENTVIGGSVSGGTKPYKYRWTPETGLSSPASANPSVSAESSLTYYVTITDSFDCELTDSVRIDVFDRPFVELGPDVRMCRGQSVLIGSDASSGEPPYTYKWLPETGLDRADLPKANASPDSTTVYRLLVTDANGCKTMDSIVAVVIDNPKPEIAARGNTVLCVCDSLLIECTGAYSSYSWADGSHASSITVKKAGTYYVTVTDENGCSGVSNNIEVEYFTPVVNLNMPETVGAKIGESVEVPLSVSFDDNFVKCNRFDCSGILQFNKTVLLPTGDTPMGYTDDKNRFVPFSGVVSTNDGVIRNFNFIAALGNAPGTELVVTDFLVGGCAIAPVLSRSSVVIEDMCTEGDSIRLLLVDKAPVITSVSPLPAADRLLLSVQSVEAGRLSISLSNLFGTELLGTEASVEKGNSTLSLDLGAVASGVYYLRCSNGKRTMYRKIVIIK